MQPLQNLWLQQSSWAFLLFYSSSRHIRHFSLVGLEGVTYFLYFVGGLFVMDNPAF
jgi:hypothetical protein